MAYKERESEIDRYMKKREREREKEDAVWGFDDSRPSTGCTFDDDGAVIPCYREY